MRLPASLSAGFTLAAATLAASPAAAQYIDYNAVNVTSNLQTTMREAVAPQFGTFRPSRRPSTRMRTSQVAGDFARPGAAATKRVEFSYVSTPALRRSALDGYLSRASQADPEAARLMAAQFAGHDYSKIFSGLIAGSPLRADDAADAVVAYTLLGWQIANQSTAPISDDQVRAVRSQVATGLSAQSSLAAAKTRAELAEEMKLLYVTLHAGWQGAEKEGATRKYSDGVTAMFKRFTGNDLRAMRLTERGFERG